MRALHIISAKKKKWEKVKSETKSKTALSYCEGFIDAFETARLNLRNDLLNPPEYCDNCTNNRVDFSDTSEKFCSICVAGSQFNCS